MYELTLPKLGQAMEESELIEWLYDEGDEVSEGDPVLFFETDKTTAEVVAESDRILLAKKVSENETVPVGTVLGYIGSPEDEIPNEAAETATESGLDEEMEADTGKLGSIDMEQEETGIDEISESSTSRDSDGLVRAPRQYDNLPGRTGLLSRKWGRSTGLGKLQSPISVGTLRPGQMMSPTTPRRAAAEVR